MLIFAAVSLVLLGYFVLAAIIIRRTNYPMYRSTRFVVALIGILLTAASGFIFRDLPFYISHPDGKEVTGLTSYQVTTRGRHGRHTTTYLYAGPGELKFSLNSGDYGLKDIKPYETLKIKYLPTTGIVIRVERTESQAYNIYPDSLRYMVYGEGEKYVEVYSLNVYIVIMLIAIPAGILLWLFIRFLKKNIVTPPYSQGRSRIYRRTAKK